MTASIETSINANKQSFVALTDPKSPTNVGAVMRAAGCFNLDGVFYSGTRFNRAAQFNTDTKKVHQSTPLTHSEDFIASKPTGCHLVCVDLVDGATPLNQFEHPDNAMYLFGPEDGTISQALIDQADAVVYIPTHGCLNLAASVNVVLYDRIAKLGSIQPSNQLVLTSRDNNNRVKVR